MTDREADTLPPGPVSLEEEIADLKVALLSSNELAIATQASLLETRRLMIRLTNRLSVLGIAQLANEAKGNNHDLEIEDLKRRVFSLEQPAAE